ncbi:hypothetical protein JCM19235_3382 [Vibrio maritimus]|uniref:Uncharacterized protein n=1 Tax=Vibrio maritimus TaxID=990268 RepID=A0A090RY44_9VIBR|nr:hypothetical protein JCM19235_3382 [Vibrio maritimus]
MHKRHLTVDAGTHKTIAAELILLGLTDSETLSKLTMLEI